MIETLKDTPDNVAGFRATGKVTKDDYKTVIEPHVKEIAKQNNEVNFLMLMDTDIENYTAGAVLQDMLLGFKELTKWNRVAVVSDSENLKKAVDAFSVLAPGNYKGFPKEEYMDAVSWVSHL
ncbi:hypothetical protein GCM10007424_15350 [Flavobacterium suaedae]|uniref:STAS/SEC14 domain-containing protein n=1 Tax=Flavobacterium suaedae TaxID=1767027 RepID=A0ABQ1JTY0_9FLAO|nr:STAS/SEC14 domain-containing protein [Flavobacterium suaedae]GGB76272.1 hypothetical protein GCM10007424_15350 [Flavobacterium suaedae]